jgi:hypothetical protein
MLVDEEGAIWFRQSWLDTAMRCNERGRLSMVKPEYDQATNDSALLGTAAHAAIANVLNGDTDPADIGADASVHAYTLCENEQVHWTKWALPSQLAAHAARCAEAWARELMPYVPPGGIVEHEFAVPLFESRGRTVGIKGQIDYADPTGCLWDWKTATKRYWQREKQRSAVQPSVYAVAAMHGGLPEDYGYRYPIRFRYGVMIRGETSASAQLVDVMRTENHEAWLLDHLRTYIDLADGLGVARPWPRSEESFLCSEVWCPWWSICKGARLTPAENTWSH